MKLEPFVPERDFERIRNWIADERAHAMWCANRFGYPLEKDSFMQTLSVMAERTGDVPYAAVSEDGRTVGFFCLSVNRDIKEGRLKFVIVDPECRGKGTAPEMLVLALAYAFEHTDAETVSLSVFPENIRAQKCYEKIGFTERNTDRKAFAFGDESWDRCNMLFRKEALKD